MGKEKGTNFLENFGQFLVEMIKFKLLPFLLEISLRVHPYEEEITSLMENLSTPVEFVNNREQFVMDDSYVWINTEEKLEMLASLLTKEKAFAVDTEQHSLRSFLGFTALMQVIVEPYI